MYEKFALISSNKSTGGTKIGLWGTKIGQRRCFLDDLGLGSRMRTSSVVYLPAILYPLQQLYRPQLMNFYFQIITGQPRGTKFGGPPLPVHLLAFRLYAKIGCSILRGGSILLVVDLKIGVYLEISREPQAHQSNVDDQLHCTLVAPSPHSQILACFLA